MPALGYIVENQLLQHAVLGVLDDTDVVYRFGTAIDAIEFGDPRHELLLADGTRLPADLIIGADGANSIRAACGRHRHFIFGLRADRGALRICSPRSGRTGANGMAAVPT